MAYNVPGCREIVIDGVNGFLIPFKDNNSLRDAILKLIKDQDLCDSMGFLGRDIVLKNFSQKKKFTLIIYINILKLFLLAFSKVLI